MLITREELALRPITVEKTYPAGEFDDRGSMFSQTSPLHVQAVAELVNSDIRIRGHLDTRVSTECDRCVAQMELAVSQNFDLFYRPVSAIPHEGESEVSAGELEVGFYPGEGVDLAEVIREQVVLALPMKRVCRPDCRGLCPVCGSNLNLTACGCRQQPSAGSPLADLLGRS
ncbi:MAG: YceD family protein [Terriglobia bacterium]